MLNLPEMVYDGELTKVVELPHDFKTRDWDAVEQFVKQGYTIKAIFETTYTKKKQVFLEKIR